MKISWMMLGASLGVALLGAGCAGEGTRNGPELDEQAEKKPDPLDEGQDGVVRGTALLRFGRDHVLQKVPYVVVDGQAIAQGDILLGRVEDVEAESAHPELGLSNPGGLGGDSVSSAIGVQDSFYLWDDGIVPFALDDSLEDTKKTQIRAAMAHWERHTVIRFVEKSVCDLFENCVTFVRNTAGQCNSHVGQLKILGVPARQEVNVADWCNTGNLIHEIGHAIGLWHEHNRSDRDNFISVKWNNFSTDLEDLWCRDQFAREIDSGKNIGPYDFGSIMHYSVTSDCAATDGLPLFTFVQPPPAGVEVGQRVRLSDGDLNGVTQMYGSWVSRKYAEYLWPSTYWLVGDPISDEGRSKDWGRYRHYQYASIYWHPDTGAHRVSAEIRSKWEALGWEWGMLGYPISDTEWTAAGQQVCHFQGGSIYWRSDTGHQVMVSDGSGVRYDYESGIKGHVDDITPWRGLRGWAYDVQSPGTSIAVHFYVDGPAGFAGVTNVYRPDVNEGFGIWGVHGFELAIPEQYYDGQQHTVYVYGIDVQGQHNPSIDGVPYTFTFAGAEGDVNRILEGGVVEGWALDLNSRSTSIDVHYYIDGPAGSGAAGFAAPTNVYREDVNATFWAPGNHGFSFTIPSEYHDGYFHSIYVYAIDAQGRHNPLIGGPMYFSVGAPPPPDPDPDPWPCRLKPWLCEDW